LGSSRQPLELSCVQDAPCQARIVSASASLDGGAVLILDGKTFCGSISVEAGARAASSRAAFGFVGILNPLVLPNTGTPVSVLAFDLGTPVRAGFFTVCYCMKANASDCMFDKHFDQKAGDLTVRGLTSPQGTECVAFSPCGSQYFGYGLGLWDQLHVIANGQVDLCGGNASLELSVGQNPSSLPRTVVLQESWAARSFSLGVPLKVGIYGLCYCPSYDASVQPSGAQPSTLSCQRSSDFATTANLLWVRGIDNPDFRFGCVRADEPIASESLVLRGLGLKPSLDKVLFVPWEGSQCGVSEAVANGIAPNPSNVQAVGELSTWGKGLGTSEVSWKVTQATKVGVYRVCFCADSPGRSCLLASNYVHQAGQLTVRGAAGGQLFVCREGYPCSLTIQGLGMSPSDRVSIVGASTTCGFGEVGGKFAEGSPAPAATDHSTDAEVTFHVGVIKIVGKPLSLRVCYCANRNADNQGDACVDALDFSHSAGIINTVVCPNAPLVKDFNPSVEDVFGDEPHLSLWLVESRACSDQNSRSESELEQFSSPFPSSGQTQANTSVVVSTADGRCNTSITSNTAKMNSLLSAGMRFEVLGRDRSVVSLPFALKHGYRISVTPSVMDTQLHSFQCPTWDVRFVSFACDWTGALYYGIILHLAVLSAGFVLFVNANLELLGALLSRLRKRIARLETAEQSGGVVKKNAAVPPAQPAPKTRLVRLLAALGQRSARLMSIAPHLLGNALAWGGLDSVFGLAEAQVTASRAKDWRAHAERHLDLKGTRLEGDLVLPLLTDVGSTLCLAGARVSVFATHALLLYSSRAEDLGVVMLLIVPAICVTVASSIQAIVVFAIEGVRGIERAQGMYLPMFYSVIAVSKLHLDLSLPWILRKHHCELWRVALLIFYGAVFVQIVMPLASLLIYFLPARRSLAPWSRRAASRCLALDEESQALPSAPQLAATAVHAATPAAAIADGPNAASVDAATTAGSKDGVGAPQQALVPSDHVHQTEARLRSHLAAQGVAGMKSQDRLPDVDRRTGFFARKCGARLHYFFSSTTRHALWSSFVFSAPFRSSPPEALQRRRLIGLYSFMDAAGWHVGTAMTRDLIERSTGLHLDTMEARSVTLMILVGGLDLAAMHAFLLLFYFSRLSFIEFAVSLLSAIVGVLQCSRPGIGRAIYEFSIRWIRHPLHGLALFLALFVLRTIVSAPLLVGCPDVTLAFTAWSVSVLFVELPLYAVVYPYMHPELFGGRRQMTLRKQFLRFLRRWRLMCCRCRWNASPAAVVRGINSPSQSLAKAVPASSSALAPDVALELPPAAVLKYPGSEPLTTAVFRLIETLSDDARLDLLGSPTSEIRQLQGAVQRLYGLPPPKQGLRVRVERLFLAGKVLRAAAEKVRQQSRPCRMAFDEMRELMDQELHFAQMARRSTALANSWHYSIATLGSRAQVAAAVLPQAPKLWLVHWRTLDTIKRLPDIGEKEFLVAATAAHQEHADKAVLIPVIHRWRTECNPDPHGVTCRQLVTFAHWYRARWGCSLEVFYWIDCCCLPELAGEMQGGASAVMADMKGGKHSQPVGVLNPIARRGLRSLPCWIEENQPECENQEVKGLTVRKEASQDEFDVETLVSQAGADALLPLIFAASDAVVLCESRDCEKNAWVRLGLAMARAFAPSGRLLYALDRNLVHVPQSIRRPLERDAPPLIFTTNSFFKQHQFDKTMHEADTNLGQEQTDMVCVAQKHTVAGNLGSGFHCIAGSSGATFFADHAGMAYQLAHTASARLERGKLLDPTDWGNVEIHRPEQHRFRVARLAAMCLDDPTLVTASGFRRQLLSFANDNSIHICRIEGKTAATRRSAKAVRLLTGMAPSLRAAGGGGTAAATAPAPPKLREGSGAMEESSSESSDEEIQHQHKFGGLGSGSMAADIEHDQMPDLSRRVQNIYHTTVCSSSVEDAAHKSTPAASLTQSAGISAVKHPDGWQVGSQTTVDRVTASATDRLINKAGGSPGESAGPRGVSAMMKPLPPKKGTRDPDVSFHSSFRPRTVSIGGLGQTAEQIRQANSEKVASGTSAHFPSGGMAILSRPLLAREGVAPDVPVAKGIFFSVTLELADSCWQDGLGIGFTSQDPDSWPNNKVKPRYASSLPSACLCGYSGRWIVNGKSEIIRKVPGNAQSWTPKTLRVGDTVTAVLAAPPADVFRILVNGRVVAERSASQGDLPDALSGRQSVGDRVCRRHAVRSFTTDQGCGEWWTLTVAASKFVLAPAFQSAHRSISWTWPATTSWARHSSLPGFGQTLCWAIGWRPAFGLTGRR